MKRRWVFVVVAVACLTGLAFIPSDTRQGVDGSVTAYSLPLYAKALDFVQRNSSYGRLARRLVSDTQSESERALTLFTWTHEHIRDVPDGFPVVDDHVANIIIRGYGQADQKADVFTTLATYAGVPAFMAAAGSSRPPLVLSVAWIERQWKIFDVENGIVFRNRRGELLSTDELARDHSLVSVVAAGRVYRSRPYESYFEQFRPPVPPDILRPELQMIWPRFSYEMKRMVGLGREWQDGR